MKTTTWVIVIETIALCFFIFITIKSCNEVIVNDTHVQDSLRLVVKKNDSAFNHYKDSSTKVYHQLELKDSSTSIAYYNVRKALDQREKKISGLMNEVDRLKQSDDIDSCRKAITIVENAYASLVDLMNDLANNADSALQAKDESINALKSMLAKTGEQVEELKKERDAFDNVIKDKDETITKLQKKNKSKNLWLKIEAVGIAIIGIFAAVK